MGGPGIQTAGDLGHPAGEVHSRSSRKVVRMGKQGHGPNGRAPDGDGQAVLAVRDITQDEVDPESFLCRHDRQGGAKKSIPERKQREEKEGRSSL